MNTRGVGAIRSRVSVSGGRYQLIEGALTELRRYETDPDRPNELIAWLEPLLSERAGLAPEARAVAQALGKGA